MHPKTYKATTQGTCEGAAYAEFSRNPTGLSRYRSPAVPGSAKQNAPAETNMHSIQDQISQELKEMARWKPHTLQLRPAAGKLWLVGNYWAFFQAHPWWESDQGTSG